MIAYAAIPDQLSITSPVVQPTINIAAQIRKLTMCQRRSHSLAALQVNNDVP